MKKEDYIIYSQRKELTEHLIYDYLSKKIKNKKNKQILKNISNEELGHYNYFKNLTKKDYPPFKYKILKHKILSKLFGLVFSIQLMERDEKNISKFFKTKQIPNQIMFEEKKHEQQLIQLIQEEKLIYIGSIVLGLNDALVEMTGTLAGLTLAFRDTSIVGIAGLITGIAATLSMASSEYISKKTENKEQKPMKAAIYTGITYIGAVILLVLPYFILKNIFACLITTIITAILLIALFTYYISVAKNLNFRKKFFEMATIGLGIALLSFIIGFFINRILGISI